MYNSAMARAATTTDAFNAVAEPRRREILDLLAEGERPVNDLVALTGLTQPQVSKHLKVLRNVGLVEARVDGRQRLYRANPKPLQSIHEWVKQYEAAWNDRLDALDVLLDEMKGAPHGGDDEQQQGRGDDADRHDDPDRP